jgi:hypothetical protein
VYAAQAALASPVNSPYRPSGIDTDPAVIAVAARPQGRKRPIRTAVPPYRRSARSARTLAATNRRWRSRPPAFRPSR